MRRILSGLLFLAMALGPALPALAYDTSFEVLLTNNTSCDIAVEIWHDGQMLERFENNSPGPPVKVAFQQPAYAGKNKRYEYNVKVFVPPQGGGSPTYKLYDDNYVVTNTYEIPAIEGFGPHVLSCEYQSNCGDQGCTEGPFGCLKQGEHGSVRKTYGTCQANYIIW